MESSSLNQVDVDRLQYLWDLIKQTNTLCEVMRTLVAAMKGDTVDISTKSMQMLQEKIDRKKNPGDNK
jgi:hypothetical protein